ESVMSRIAFLVPMAALLLGAACQPSGNEADDERSAAERSADSDTGGATAPGAAGEHDEHAAAGQGGETDHEPQLLRTIMQQLSVDMAGLSHAIWLENYEEMESRAAAIAEHAHMMPSEVERISSTLGPEMAGFEEADMAVHESSVRLHQLVETRDIQRIVQQLGEV